MKDPLKAMWHLEPRKVWPFRNERPNLPAWSRKFKELIDFQPLVGFSDISKQDFLGDSSWSVLFARSRWSYDVHSNDKADLDNSTTGTRTPGTWSSRTGTPFVGSVEGGKAVGRGWMVDQMKFAFRILDLGLPMSLEVRHVARFKKEHEVQKNRK